MVNYFLQNIHFITFIRLLLSVIDKILLNILLADTGLVCERTRIEKIVKALTVYIKLILYYYTF